MHQTVFATRSRGDVAIDIDDEAMIAHVRTLSGQNIGRLEFEVVDDPQQEHLYLRWAHLEDLPGYTQQGIGRQCLKLMMNIFGLPITAAPNDGQKRDDGSHLTGDAPEFVRRMKLEGLIAQGKSERYEE